MAGGSPLPVGGAITVHVDRFVVLGDLGRGLVPTREIMVGAHAGRMVLAIAGAAGVGVPSVRCPVKFVGAATEERDPAIIRVGVKRWRGCVDVEKGNRCTLLSDLERGYL